MSERERQNERTPAHWPPDQELAVGKVVWAGMALTAATALAAVAMWYLSVGLRDSIESADPPPPALLEALAPYEPPSPRLQVDPPAELRALRAEDEAVLQSYAWVDEATGTARVPIDRAIDLLLASRPDAAAFGTAVSGTGVSGTGASGTGSAAEAAPPVSDATAATSESALETNDG